MLLKYVSSEVMPPPTEILHFYITEAPFRSAVLDHI